MLEHPTVQMGVQIGGRAKMLDEDDSTCVGGAASCAEILFVKREPGVLVRLDGNVVDA